MDSFLLLVTWRIGRHCLERWCPKTIHLHVERQFLLRNSVAVFKIAANMYVLIENYIYVCVCV